MNAMKMPLLRKSPLLLLLLLLASPLVAARMYQWTDPDTGTPQLSGKPPYWYRGDEAGPRIFVIDNGKVVDDTAVSVPESRRQQLREQAFLRAEEDEASFRAKLEEAQRLKMERASQEEVDLAAEAPAATAEPAPAETPEAATADTDEDAMRALVEQWERLREETARKVIHE